ncbi:MAG: ribosome small subunit-dependent GTPase A [candidate division Zixibacteria bacterium]|nr:ribosome small subunit-dependent GTPase A [candidate division Zixibacteria bacterium]
MKQGEQISGRVVKAYGRLFWVQAGDRQLLSALRDKVKKQAESKISPVVVGDKVMLEILADPDKIDPSQGNPQAVITEVAPRLSRFSRPKRGREDLEQIVAANIEQMLIVTSVARPSFKPHLVDRFLVAAASGGLTPIIIVNKIDLAHDIDLDQFRETYSRLDIGVILTSVTEKTGLKQFEQALKDKISVIAGQSGVGKSSLLNAIEPELNIRIGEVSEYSQKGVHTTTAVEMHTLTCGGFVVDTPGLKYLGLWGIEATELQYLFPEIERYAGYCRFSDCLHRGEPGCGIRDALAKGLIDKNRYQSYLTLLDEQKQQEGR